MIVCEETCLRAPRPEDRSALGALRNDFELQSQLMALPRANSASRVDAWVEGVLSDPQSLFFVITASDHDSALGFIQLRRMEWVHRHAELGIALSTAARGRGHAARAIRSIERHASDVFAIRKVLLQVLAGNERAVAVYRKCGYTIAGTLREHFYHHGQFHDVIVMEHHLGVQA